jgi:hypothetical protein
MFVYYFIACCVLWYAALFSLSMINVDDTNIYHSQKSISDFDVYWCLSRPAKKICDHNVYMYAGLAT